MASGNFDQIDGAGVGTDTNEFASMRRAPVVPRGANALEISDPDGIIESEYDLYKDQVLKAVASKLSAQKISFPAIDLEAFYNQAWHTVYMKLADGEEVENRRGVLVTIAYRRAVDDFRAQHPDRFTEVDSLDLLSTETDLDAALDDRAKL